MLVYLLVIFLLAFIACIIFCNNNKKEPIGRGSLTTMHDIRQRNNYVNAYMMEGDL